MQDHLQHKHLKSLSDIKRSQLRIMPKNTYNILSYPKSSLLSVYYAGKK
jgi:hypothetical protein